MYYTNPSEMEKDFVTNKLELKFLTATKVFPEEKIIKNFGNYQLYIITKKNNEKLAQQIEAAINKINIKQIFETSYWHEYTSDSRILSAGDITQKERQFINSNPLIYYTSKIQMDKTSSFLHDITGFNFSETYILSPNFINHNIIIEPFPADNDEINDFFDSSTIPYSHFSQWLILNSSISPETFFSRAADSDSSVPVPVTFAFWSDIIDTMQYYTDKFGNFNYKEYDSISKCLNAVSNNTCGATIIPDYLLGTTHSLSEYPNLQNAHLYKYEVPYVLLINGDSSGYVKEILDKAIKQMPADLASNQISEISKMMPHTPGKLAVRKQFKQIGLYIIIVCVMFVFFYFWRKYTHFHQWAFTDYLTGLSNRRSFEITAEKYLKSFSKQNFAIIESDIRGFKYINRIYGYSYGDEALIFFADCLRKYNGHIICFARGYADQFYIMISSKDKDDCIKNYNDFFNWFTVQSAHYNYHFLIKSGIALTGKDYGTDTIQKLIDKSSYAKQSLKRDRINSFSLFTPEMDKKMQIDEKIESCITKAFERNEFFIMYQPKTDLNTGRITGAEALVRWNSPENGLLYPDSFLPILEREGFIIKLDFYVYRKVFEFIRTQIDNGEQVVPISVNMSRMHLNTPDFVKNFTEEFEQYDIPSSCIEIEVIERATGMNDTLLIKVTKELQEKGFRVAMDDFGSGESSLNMLHTIPVNVLKLDKEFLNQAENSLDSKIIITKIIEMAKQLGKTTVCEGVETSKQADFLRSVGCDMVQGFYFSKPLAEKDFLTYVKNHL